MPGECEGGAGRGWRLSSQKGPGHASLLPPLLPWVFLAPLQIRQSPLEARPPASALPFTRVMQVTLCTRHSTAWNAQDRFVVSKDACMSVLVHVWGSVLCAHVCYVHACAWVYVCCGEVGCCVHVCVCECAMALYTCMCVLCTCMCCMQACSRVCTCAVCKVGAHCQPTVLAGGSGQEPLLIRRLSGKVTAKVTVPFPLGTGRPPAPAVRSGPWRM